MATQKSGTIVNRQSTVITPRTLTINDRSSGITKQIIDASDAEDLRDSTVRGLLEYLVVEQRITNAYLAEILGDKISHHDIDHED